MAGSEKGNKYSVFFVFTPVPGIGHWKGNTLLLEVFPLGNAPQGSLNGEYGLREHWSELQLVGPLPPKTLFRLSPKGCSLTYLPQQGKCLPTSLGASLRSHDNRKWA